MNNSAPSIFTRWKSHFTNWREWELNPIVVKELRQSVRSWAVTGMLFLFLLVLLGTAIVILVSNSFDTNINPVIGGSIFSAFSGILTLASVLFIPLYIGVRVAAERQESNIDLLYVSTLSPGRIIRGKFFCGAYVALLFISCCMPFMAFTTLLRGVDLPTIFLSLLVLFLMVCLLVQAAIFFACLPISKGLKILLALIAMFTLIFASGTSLVFLISRSVSFGAGSISVGAGGGILQFWMAFLTTIAIGAGVGLLLYFLSVALISPPSANRALPIRAYLTLAWLVGAIFALYWMVKSGQSQLILAWAMPSFAVLLISLVVVVSNEDQLSLRVLRTVPTNPAKRAMAFLFYNGAAGGLIWVTLLTLATFVLSATLLNPSGIWANVFKSRSLSKMPQDSFDEFNAQCGSTLLYFFAYALAALWIHRRFLSRRPAKLAGVLAVILPAGLAILFYLGLFFINRLSWKSVETLQPGNMFNIFTVREPQQQLMHVYFAAGLLLIFAALNVKWFIQQARRFQRYERPNEAPPVIAETRSVLAESPVETVK